VVLSSHMVIPQGVIGADGYIQMANKFLDEETVKNPQYQPLRIPRRPKWTKEMSA